MISLLWVFHSLVKKTGLNLKRELKAHSLHNDTPILCISANAFDEENAYETGVDLFLTKSVSVQQLRKKVEDLIKKNIAEELT